MSGDARIRLITIAGAVAILLLILELVRRRKLKEEYSVLWVLTALVLLVLAISYGALTWLTRLIGGDQPSSTLFFFGLLFVVVVLLHFSVKISSLERRVTTLVQEIGLLRVEQPEAADEQAAEGGALPRPGSRDRELVDLRQESAPPARRQRP